MGQVSEVFMEKWARDLLFESNRAYREPRLHKVKLTEWLPECPIDAETIDMSVVKNR